jgi:hypothetical protein
LRARLEEIETEMRALTAKRETLAQRAAEKSAAALELRRSIMQLQLGEAPDEKAMKAARSQLLDCEADASTAKEAAAAIARTTAELSREQSQTRCEIALAEFAAAERTMLEANGVLADAMVRIQSQLEEPLRTLQQAVNDCATVAIRSWNEVEGNEEARRRLPHPEYSVPNLWRRTFWQQAEGILTSVRLCRASRNDGTR